MSELVAQLFPQNTVGVGIVPSVSELIACPCWCGGDEEHEDESAVLLLVLCVFICVRSARRLRIEPRARTLTLIARCTLAHFERAFVLVIRLPVAHW